LINNFARVRGGIEPGQLIREIIKIREIAKITADIHRIIQQRWLRIGCESGSGTKGEDNARDYGNCSHIN